MTSAPTGSVLVLAGGASRRLLRDKRQIVLEGATVLQRVVAACRGTGWPVFVAVARNGAHLAPLPGAAVLLDPVVGQGPMPAVAHGLAVLKSDVLVVAGDLPRLQTQCLTALLEAAATSPRAWAVAAATAHGPHPLLALYRRQGAAPLARAVEAGQRSLRRFLHDLPSGRVTVCSLAAPCLEGLNHGRELDRLRSRRDGSTEGARWPGQKPLAGKTS